jgi:hypothetical protein
VVFIIFVEIKFVTMRNKKFISLLSLALIIAFVACKKDKNPPTITILGNNPASVTVGSTYADAGATAINPDESVATVTADLSAVNTSSSGSFEVAYTAENEYGAANAARAVSVVISQSNYIGTYSLSSDCSATAFPLNTAQEGVASGSDGLQFDNFFNAVGGMATATISGSVITFPSQTITTIGGDVIFDGAGTMNNAGSEMTVTFNYDSSGIPLIGGTGSCTATITKQ